MRSFNLFKRKSLYVNGFSDRIVTGIAYLFITIFVIACVYPFLLVLGVSFTDEYYIIQNGFQLIPEGFSLEGYNIIIKSGVVFKSYMVTIFVTVVGTVLSLLVTCGIAYAISLKQLKYRNKIAFYVYFTMLFSGGLVPSYLLISKYLNMVDTIWVLIIPALVSPWNMFLMRNFFNTIPNELAESARIDGASELRILWSVVLPVAKPAIATIGLFYALGYWNEWFKAMLYIRDESLYPLQYLIMRIIRNLQFADQMANQAGVHLEGLIPDYSVRMATTILTIGPIIFAYPFVQKYFVKGLTVGSIKG